MFHSDRKHQLSPEQLGAAIRAYMAEQCPVCEAPKKRRSDPLCSRCFDKLPEDLQAKIATKEHFLEAFHPAMRHLSGSAANTSRAEKAVS
jgi:hypothetical protein